MLVRVLVLVALPSEALTVGVSRFTQRKKCRRRRELSVRGTVLCAEQNVFLSGTRICDPFYVIRFIRDSTATAAAITPGLDL